MSSWFGKKPSNPLSSIESGNPFYGKATPTNPMVTPPSGMNPLYRVLSNTATDHTNTAHTIFKDIPDNIPCDEVDLYIKTRYNDEFQNYNLSHDDVQRLSA